MTTTLLLAAILLVTPPESPLTGSAVKVVDGDTLDLASDGQTYRIRLAEIDCPDAGQPYWGEARGFLERRTANREMVVNIVNKDKWGRYVGHCYVDGASLNRELVSQGFAWQDPRYSKDSNLAADQMAAKGKQRGLWAGDTRPIAPWEWRKMSAKERDRYRLGETSSDSAILGVASIFIGVASTIVVWGLWEFGKWIKRRVARAENIGPLFDVNA